MWARTTNPNNESYRRYSSFKPPDRWKEFEKFLEDMGECPDGYSLERIKNDEGYGPKNCEWIPLSRQARNRSTTVWVDHEGQKLTLKGSRRTGGLRLRCSENASLPQMVHRTDAGLTVQTFCGER